MHENLAVTCHTACHTMIRVKEARDRILERVSVLGTEKVDIFSALGRVLAEPIIAPYDVPPYQNSAMDGYAVRVQDVRQASPDYPVVLDVIDDLPAGYMSQKQLRAGQAIRIMTGAPVPQGADAVVRVEDTERGEHNTARIFQAAKPQANIRMAGEDIQEGDCVLKSGGIIRPADVGVFASLGKSFVHVYQRAQVAILSTGDELVDIDEPRRPGTIINSNSFSLAALVLETGAVPIQLGIARDTREDLETKFMAGVRADAIISSGGVSVGDYDLVRDFLQQNGSQMSFWKVGMKPGKPQAFGMIQGTPLFGLPGNPVASMVSYEILVRPALLKMMGHSRIYRPIVSAVIQEDIRKRDTCKHFLRVTLKEEHGVYLAFSTGAQGSGILTSMSKANGLAIVDEDCTSIEKGQHVSVMVLDPSLGMRDSREF